MPPAGGYAPSGIPRLRGYRGQPTPLPPRQLGTPLGQIQPVFDGFYLAETSDWLEPPTPGPASRDVFGGHHGPPLSLPSPSSTQRSQASPKPVLPHCQPPPTETPRVIAPLRASRFKTPAMPLSTSTLSIPASGFTQPHPPPVLAATPPVHPDDLYARRLADSVRQTPRVASPAPGMPHRTVSTPGPIVETGSKRPALLSTAHTPRKRPNTGEPQRSGKAVTRHRIVVGVNAGGKKMTREERAAAAGQGSTWRPVSAREVTALRPVPSSRTPATSQPAAATPPVSVLSAAKFTYAYPPPSMGRTLNFSQPRPDLGRDIIQLRYASPAVSQGTADGRDEDWDVSARTSTPQVDSTPRALEALATLSPVKRVTASVDRSPARIAYWALPASPGSVFEEEPPAPVAEDVIDIGEASEYAPLNNAPTLAGPFEPALVAAEVVNKPGLSEAISLENAPVLVKPSTPAVAEPSFANVAEPSFPTDATPKPAGSSPLVEPNATPSSRRESGGIFGFLTNIFGASPAVDSAPAASPAMRQISPAKPVTLQSVRQSKKGRPASTESLKSSRPADPKNATTQQAKPPGSSSRTKQIPAQAKVNDGLKRRPLDPSTAVNEVPGQRDAGSRGKSTVAMATSASQAKAKNVATASAVKTAAARPAPLGLASGHNTAVAPKRKVVAPSPERSRTRTAAVAPAKRPKPPIHPAAAPSTVRGLSAQPRPAVTRQSSFVARKLAALPKPGEGATSAAKPVSIRDFERARELEIKRAMFERGVGPNPDAHPEPPPRSTNATLGRHDAINLTKPGRVPGEATRRRAEIQAANRAERDKRAEAAAAVAAEEARVRAEVEAELERQARQATVFQAQPLPPMYNGSR